MSSHHSGITVSGTLKGLRTLSLDSGYCRMGRKGGRTLSKTPLLCGEDISGDLCIRTLCGYNRYICLCQGIPLVTSSVCCIYPEIRRGAMDSTLSYPTFLLLPYPVCELDLNLSHRTSAPDCPKPLAVSMEMISEKKEYFRKRSCFGFCILCMEPRTLW